MMSSETFLFITSCASPGLCVSLLTIAEAARSAAIEDGVVGALQASENSGPLTASVVKREDVGYYSQNHVMEPLHSSAAAAQMKNPLEIQSHGSTIHANPISKDASVTHSLPTKPKSSNVNHTTTAKTTSHHRSSASTSSAAAGANSSGSKRKGPLLRRGKWTLEEEAYANRLIQEFKAGLLPLTDGTTLRTFLSKLLNCDPMR